MVMKEKQVIKDQNCQICSIKLKDLVFVVTFDFCCWVFFLKILPDLLSTIILVLQLDFVIFSEKSPWLATKLLNTLTPGVLWLTGWWLVGAAWSV